MHGKGTKLSRGAVTGLLSMIVFATLVAAAAFRDTPGPTAEYAGTSTARDFPTGLDWINTGGDELSLERLRGKVVVLDFWTYGCINCMHIIPDLKRLEHKYGNALVVVGVHSAKFENEAKTENIRKIAQRYERDEPIVNDHAFTIWRDYGIRAWPTLVVIDPLGRVLGKVEGEGHFDVLDEVIGGMIEHFEASGDIDRTPLGLDSDMAALDSPLAFPGKVLADAANRRLYIADSNHDRIVIAGFDGKVLATVGGERGYRDGGFAEARFKGPQGLALGADGSVFVADTLNNTIRRIDPEAKVVTTVAGDGKREYLVGSPYPARKTGLNSPWDVVWHDGVLYIAMAGQHQLWAWHPGDDEVRVFAGTRREELRDGPRTVAGFNQPSGLAVFDGRLLVADSEASAIRAVGLGKDGEVTTLVGTGLFDFGDRDGVGDAVRLQHALGVAVHDGSIYIADTYNGKVKRLDPRTRRATTFVASGLDEPGGVSVAGDTLFVADTNNHRIVKVNLKTGVSAPLELIWP